MMLAGWTVTVTSNPSVSTTLWRLRPTSFLAPIRQRKRQRVALPPRGIQTTSTWQRGDVWAIDFMQDVLADGRRFCLLTIVDTITHECLAIEVDTSLPGQRVVRILEPLGDSLVLRAATVPDEATLSTPGVRQWSRCQGERDRYMCSAASFEPHHFSRFAS
jgi:putative transposase